MTWYRNFVEKSDGSDFIEKDGIKVYGEWEYYYSPNGFVCNNTPEEIEAAEKDWNENFKEIRDLFKENKED